MVVPMKEVLWQKPRSIFSFGNELWLEMAWHRTNGTKQWKKESIFEEISDSRLEAETRGRREEFLSGYVNIKLKKNSVEVIGKMKRKKERKKERKREEERERERERGRERECVCVIEWIKWNIKIFNIMLMEKDED